MAVLFAMTARSAAQPTRDIRTGRLASAALLLSASFVVSRVLGLLRNVLIADVFGNSRAIEAYFSAFRLPDTMYALVSGGALASAFIPVFAGLIEGGDEDTAWAVASTTLNTVFLVLAALAALAFVLAGPLMALFLPSYPAAERGLTVELTRIMLLQPIFLGLQAIVTAILQTYHRFTITAVAPLAYTGFAIVGALLGRFYGVSALAWSIVLGAAAYLAIQLPELIPAARYRLEVDWKAPAAREVLNLLGPRIVGLGAFQGMLLITWVLATGLPQGAWGAINYAWVLIWFPVSALGTAAATAIFPTLSRLSAADELRTLARTVNRSLRLVLFLAIPAAAGLALLRLPIINLLYFHGSRWTSHASEQTALAVVFYALAIAPLAAIEVLPRVFYALKETVTPVRIAVSAVVIDAVLSIVLVHVLAPDAGQAGLALATAVASAAQAIWLAIALEDRLGDVGRRGLLLTLRDTLLATAAMILVVYDTSQLLGGLFAQPGWGALLTLAVELPLGVASFAAAAWILGAPELFEVRGFLTRAR